MANEDVQEEAQPQAAEPQVAEPQVAQSQGMPRSQKVTLAVVGVFAVAVLGVGAALAIPKMMGPPRITAEEVVEEYFAALAEGDSTTAKTYLPDYVNRKLLTDRQLEASAEIAKLDNVKVGKADTSSSKVSVPVTYTLGEKKVSTSVSVYLGDSDDEIELTDATYELQVPVNEVLNPKVNGVVATGNVTVFPGAYVLTTGSENITFGDVEPVLVTSDEEGKGLAAPTPALTDAGKQAFTDIVTRSLNACLEMQMTDTPCGLDADDIPMESPWTPMFAGVESRTLTLDSQAKLAAMTPELREDGTAIYNGKFEADIRLTLFGGDAIAQRSYPAGVVTGTPVVDFTELEPTLSWR